MMKYQRRARIPGVRSNDVAVRARYLDTRYGFLLTRTPELDATERIVRNRSTKLIGMKKISKELKEALESASKNSLCESRRPAIIHSRAVCLCVYVHQFLESRYLKMRCDIVKENKFEGCNFLMSIIKDCLHDSRREHSRAWNILVGSGPMQAYNKGSRFDAPYGVLSIFP